MKKLFFFVILLLSTTVFSQLNDTAGQAAEKTRQRDSAIDLYQRKRDSLNNLIHSSDTALIRQQVKSSADYFIRLQKENRAKEKKAAITRIGFGLAMLVVLIIGLRRRKKLTQK